MSGDIVAVGGNLPIKSKGMFSLGGEITPKDAAFFRNVASVLMDFSKRNKGHDIRILRQDDSAISLKYRTPRVTQHDVVDFLNATYDYDPRYRKQDRKAGVLMPGMLTASFPINLVEMLFPEMAGPSYEIRFREPQPITNEKGDSEKEIGSLIEMEMRKGVYRGMERLQVYANCYTEGNVPPQEMRSRNVKRRGEVFVEINAGLPSSADEDSKIYVPMEDEIFDLFYGSRSYNPEFVEERAGRFKTRGYIVSLVPGEISEAMKNIGLTGIYNYRVQTLAFNERGVDTDDFEFGVHFNERRAEKFRENIEAQLKLATLVKAEGYTIASGEAILAAQKE
jgi:hypothetical protein